MAIKDGIYGHVSGTVGKSFDAKNGRAVTIEVKDEKAQYPDRVTAWGVDFEVAEGDRVSLKGWLSWRREVKDDKTYFNVSLNKPQLLEREAAVQSAPAAAQWADSAPAADVWPSAEVPF